MIEIGHHALIKAGGLYFHLDTIISMVIVSSILIIGSIILRFAIASSSIKKISFVQAGIELCLEALEGIPVGVMGNKGAKYVPVISSLFIFILFSNLFGLVPVNAFYSLFFEKTFGHIPELTAPTANINTTVGLAIFIFIASHYFGVREKGFKYLKRFISPNFVFLPLNIIEELAKPFSLAIRLFGNTFGKETIVLILISLTVFPIIYPIPILALGIFIAFLQAFIFSLLSTFYIAAAISEGH